MDINNNDTDEVVSTPINPPRLHVVSQSQHLSDGNTQLDDTYSFYTCDDQFSGYQSPLITDGVYGDNIVDTSIPSPSHILRQQYLASEPKITPVSIRQTTNAIQESSSM